MSENPYTWVQPRGRADSVHKGRSGVGCERVEWILWKGKTIASSSNQVDNLLISRFCQMQGGKLCWPVKNIETFVY